MFIFTILTMEPAIADIFSCHTLLLTHTQYCTRITGCNHMRGFVYVETKWEVMLIDINKTILLSHINLSTSTPKLNIGVCSICIRIRYKKTFIQNQIEYYLPVQFSSRVRSKQLKIPSQTFSGATHFPPSHWKSESLQAENYQYIFKIP